MKKLVTKLLVTIVIGLVGVCQSMAQVAKLYTIQQGLVNSDIRSIYIDSRGMAWIMGPGNMQMFDGHRFHSISLENDATGNDICNVVYGIEEIEPMKYLVRTSNGLFEYDLSLDKFTPIYLTVKDRDADRYPIGNIVQYPKSDCKLVITNGFGVYVLNTKTLAVDKAESMKVESLLTSSFIQKSFADSQGNLWIYDAPGHLRAFNLKKMKPIRLNFESDAQAIQSISSVESFCEVSGGNIYFGTNKGLLYYDHALGKVKALPNTSVNGAPISSIIYTNQKRVFVGVDSYGLYELDAKTGSIHPYRIDNVNYNLDYSKVKCMNQDSDGNLLIGLMQKGVMVISPSSDTFRYYAVTPRGDGNNTSCVTAICPDGQGNYWIATDGSGMFKTAGRNISVSSPVNEGLRSILIQDAVVDKRNVIWVGSYGGGVQYFDGKQFVAPSSLESLANMYIMALAYNPKDDVLYIGTNGKGVYMYNINTRTLTDLEFSPAMNVWISALYFSPDEKLYVGTASGLWCYDSKTSKEMKILEEKARACVIRCVYSDGDWVLIGSNKGLLTYNIKTTESRELLTGERVASIEQTDSDYWIATATNIVSIDKKTLSMSRYTSLESSFLGEFHADCSVYDNKRIMFGGDNGIFCFTPSVIKQKKTISSPLLFTEIRCTDQRLVNIPKKLVLDHDKNTFIVEFCVPQYSVLDQIRYSYYLEGYDNEWHECSGISEVSFFSIPTGSYTFHVRAFNELDLENYVEESLAIRIKAPWYGSMMAWCIYILILFTIIFFFYKAYTSRKKQRALLHDAREKEQLKEAQLNMFTSITHELRTPLTMIISPLKQLSTSYQDEDIQEICGVMRRNCNRLLNIVKQITDIRQISSGQLKLRFQEVDFISYAQQIFSAFSESANLRQITFVEEHTEDINVWIDPVHFEKILTNILSNAFKFTPSGGKIIVRTITGKRTTPNEESSLSRKGQEYYMEINIYNNGSHIDEADLLHIFERFYQGNHGMRREGNGIGLSLVSELVELHHGSISAKNIEPLGVEFTIQIPLGNSHLTDEEMQNCDEEPEVVDEDQITLLEDIDIVNTLAEGEQIASTQKKSTVLIVDDDKELCEYISNELGKYFNILVAFGGNSAWQIVLKQRPDVIVTDIKMPDGDGIEFCKRVKNNPETDDIPIIMLTSENGDNAQLKSLNLHTDYYLSKPFNIMILRGAIGQVLRVRENLLQRISRKTISNNYVPEKIVSADDKLFAKINEKLLAHLDETEFSVERLADEVGISRVHLNRKMKERYGISPRQFIKSFKLKQAASLLIHNKVNVSEVVYKLGFSSHSFFSSSFHEYFGMTPKDFVAYYSEHLEDETLKKLLE